MAYTKSWNESTPSGSTNRGYEVDDFIRDLKVAIRERLEGDTNLHGVLATFGTVSEPKVGMARTFYDVDANKGSAPLQDGRLFQATDLYKLYLLLAAGIQEIAYLDLDGSQPMEGDIDLDGNDLLNAVNVQVTNLIERVADAGIYVDGLLIKDGGVPGGMAGGINHIGTTTGATVVDWDDGQVQTIVIGGSHAITVGAAASHNKAGKPYFLYVDANGQNPSWVGVDWGTGGEPSWSDNHLVMFVSLAAVSAMLGYDMGGGYTEAIPA